MFIVQEETVDLVVEVLQLEGSEVLLAEIQHFHLSFVNFFCHNQLEVRVNFCLALCKNSLLLSVQQSSTLCNLTT